MSTALAVIGDRGGPVHSLGVYDAQAHAAYLDAKRDIIRRMCIPKEFQADDVLLDTVLEIGKLRGLNPVIKQMWVIPRGGKPSIEISIDGARLIAHRTGLCAGIDDPVYDVEGEEVPGRATCTVWKLVAGERYPFTATVRWSEFGKAGREARYDNLWKTKPYHMLGIRAEIHALRRAFPEETSGLAIEGEGEEPGSGTPEPPLKASGMLPCGLKEDQFAWLAAEANQRGVHLTRGMTLDQMAAQIAERGGPQIPGTVKAGDIWGALKRVPQPAESPPARPARQARQIDPPAPAAPPEEPPIAGEVREERPEIDPETGEIIPPHIGQAALAEIE
jgi:phage recombination protein Bet